MAHPVDGEFAGRNRWSVVLCSLGMAAAIGLGAFAVWLIVTAETQKGTRIGALIGCWALLLGAFAVLGTRQPDAGPYAPGESAARAGGELARVEDAAARREYEYRLMEMLRREITATMSAELVTLRADVAALRGELVEKVGGQIRLERIETTRVIGSDIEALHHEVRQMMGGRTTERLSSFSLGSTHTSLVTTAEPLAVEPLRPEPIGPRSGPSVPPVLLEPPAPMPVPAEPPAPKPFSPEPPAPGPVEPEPVSPEPLSPEPLSPEPLSPEPLSPEPITPAPVTPDPISPSPVPPQAVRQETGRIPRPEPSDPFDSMPRLRPFTDFELDPVEAQSGEERYVGDRRHEGAASPVGSVSSISAASPAKSVNGRAAPNGGRHTNANGETNGSDAPSTGGGRRRRAADADDDVLARILSREATR
ncbi:MAG: hypothetical protein DLM58_02360 [Pseudonocardiales bacterium]|nr:MAG: hypothetical protein DLM58_02360 [Pseudonocardiales bacterium]